MITKTKFNQNIPLNPFVMNGNLTKLNHKSFYKDFTMIGHTEFNQINVFRVLDKHKGFGKIALFWLSFVLSIQTWHIQLKNQVN